MRRFSHFFGIASVAAVLAMSGCGGGRDAALNVYVTDGFAETYKQVQVTLSC